jgi:hypothetical protein
MNFSKILRLEEFLRNETIPNNIYFYFFTWFCFRILSRGSGEAHRLKKSSFSDRP